MISARGSERLFNELEALKLVDEATRRELWALHEQRVRLRLEQAQQELDRVNTMRRTGIEEGSRRPVAVVRPTSRPINPMLLSEPDFRLQSRNGRSDGWKRRKRSRRLGPKELQRIAFVSSCWPDCWRLGGFLTAEPDPR